MPREQLTEREEIILAALVRAHVEMGVPVGSAVLLERDPHVDISAATVRKTLSILEDKGYVQQPHTSAGRLPTDRGYRFFVAHTVDTVETPVFDLDQQRREIERKLQKLSADEIHGQLAEIIGDVTMQLGLVMAPGFELGLLARIELVHLTRQRLLLVVNLTAGPVRSLVIEVGTSVERRDLEGVATCLNERLGGLTMSQVQTTVRERVGDMACGAPELLRVVVDEIEALSQRSVVDVHVAGAHNICVQPEFRDALDVASVLELLEHKQVLAQLLAGRRGVVVTIGDENDRRELRLCSLVTASYDVAGSQGVIGVMGPTRMPYDRVVALVDYAASRAAQLSA